MKFAAHYADSFDGLIQEVTTKKFGTVAEADEFARGRAAAGWDFVTVTHETQGLLGTFAWPEDGSIMARRKNVRRKWLGWPVFEFSAAGWCDG